jgi:hypothetical protein
MPATFVMATVGPIAVKRRCQDCAYPLLEIPGGLSKQRDSHLIQHHPIDPAFRVTSYLRKRDVLVGQYGAGSGFQSGGRREASG